MLPCGETDVTVRSEQHGQLDRAEGSSKISSIVVINNENRLYRYRRPGGRVRLDLLFGKLPRIVVDGTVPGAIQSISTYLVCVSILPPTNPRDIPLRFAAQ